MPRSLFITGYNPEKVNYYLPSYKDRHRRVKFYEKIPHFTFFLIQHLKYVVFYARIYT